MNCVEGSKAKEELLSRTHVLDVVFEEDSKEMYQSVKPTCRAHVLYNEPSVLSLLNLAIDTHYSLLYASVTTFKTKQTSYK